MEDDRNYADECGDHGGTNRKGDPCGRAAGWGTDFESGKCRQHRGTSPDGSSHEGNDNAVGNSGGAPPEGNTNAVSHGLYADVNAFYTDIATDEQRELIDDTFADYRERYEARHGDLPYGHRAKLFQVAVNIAKEIHGEAWAAEKPSSLDSGHPLVDREERKKEVADMPVEEIRYKETVVLSATQKLSRDTRQWLKDFGLLDTSPESQQASALADGLDLNLTSDEKAGLDAAFDVDPQT
ncbi:hypothetical protein [Halomarina oriensis]|uniref:hypothetical protein n=1 Tax=Halomarina oriensis TaxID=671145 RepID=UPI0018EF05F6|nr:hypothetical protein [Halomarina oriensis]